MSNPMSETKPNRPRAAAVIWLLIVFAVSFDVAFLWQRAGGAYESEFGGHPDEAAHYVTGLFVRDAVTALPSCVAQKSIAPLKAFGPEAPGGFYEHYPKVALGVWPPGFYAVQTGWTLPFGVSRTSVLLLMAALAGGVGVLLYRVVRVEFGAFAGFIAAIVWLSAPLIRTYYGMVMAEMLCTLTMFGATIFWGRFLDETRMRDAVCFGLLAAAAILTKGTGLALAVMVLLSLPLTRRWSVLRNRATWVSAAIVAIIAGPWTWYFRKTGAQVGGWADNSGGTSLAFIREALPYYGGHLALAMGYAVLAFAVVGMCSRIFGRGPRVGRWAALASLVFGVLIFQCLLPVGFEERHIISATPALVVFAVVGVVWVARLPRIRATEEAAQPQREWLWLVLLVLLSFPVFAMARVQKGCAGFAPLADWLLAQSPKARVLVCSDAVGEGMFISEVAMLDERPGMTIERASKSLVAKESQSWKGDNPLPRFDDAKLLAHLTSAKIEYIILDSAIPDRRRKDYHDQLTRVIESNAPNFWKVLESPITRDGEPMYRPLRLYRVKDAKNLILK